MTKLQKAISEFAHKVSIGGLLETYQAKIRAEKLMWYVALICACFGVVYSSYNIAKKFIYQPAIYMDTEVSGGQAPFPDISICAPEAIDKALARGKLIISEKVKQSIKKHGFDVETIASLTMEFSTMKVIKPKYNDTTHFLIHKIAADSLNSFSGGFPEYVQSVYLPCEAILLNCSFDGEPFDCCNVSHLVPADDYLCYYIAVSAF